MPGLSAIQAVHRDQGAVAYYIGNASRALVLEALHVLTEIDARLSMLLGTVRRQLHLQHQFDSKERYSKSFMVFF